jgi:Undecaprenyl-phosphate glucose phosphotransferase
VGNRSLPSFIRDLVEQCRQQPVGTVVIAPSRENNVAAARIVDALAETPVTVHVVPFAENRTAARRMNDGIGGLSTAIISNQPLSSIDLSLKRGFDIAVSLFALILLAPLFLAVAIAIRLDSAGPVFFRQARHGYGNSAIRVLKFRTMHVVEDGQAFRQATRNDPRITKVGRFLRKTNLDELPQLYNVLFGEMSIVGPRPHPIALNESFSDRIKWFNRRHVIRPGITGWAQINGYRGETETIEKMAGRVEHDLWYLDNWSFFFDLKIVLLTMFSPLAYREAR